MHPQKILYIIPSIFLLIGLGMLSGAGYFANNQHQFLLSSISATGTVMELETSTSYDQKERRSYTTYYPIVEFNDAKGELIRFRGEVGSDPPSYERGEAIPVRYLVDKPGDAKIDSFFQLWLLPIILGFIGAIFTLVSGLILRSSRKRKQDIEWLTQHGQRIRIDITGIDFNRSLTVNNKHPYQIIGQWQSPTKDLHVFKSENLWFDPTSFIGGKQIDVLIDQNNPKRYVMDTSFLPKEG